MVNQLSLNSTLKMETYQEQIAILEKASDKNFQIPIDMIYDISKSPNVKSLIKLIPQRLIDSTEIIERIIFNNYNYETPYFSADLIHEILKVKPTNNILKLILTRCSMYYNNSYQLLNCIPKELINNDTAKIIINTFHNEMPRVLQFIPKNLLNDEIIQMIINNCNNSDIQIITREIPKELFNDEIVKLIINVGSINTYCVLDYIPINFFNDEIVKLIVERQDKKNMHRIIKHIPKELLNNENVKLIINKCMSERIADVVKYIPQETFDEEIVKLIGDNCHFVQDYNYIKKNIPEKLLNNEIKKSITTQRYFYGFHK